MNYRKNEHELNYFGSDLNKFIQEKCKKSKDGLIVNNIDLILFEYKKNDLKIIESKHVLESIKLGQFSILKILKNQYKINTYIIFSDYPFDDFYVINNFKLKNSNYIYKNKKEINLNDFEKYILYNKIQFINFINTELICQ